MRKRLFALLLAAVMVMGAAVGCSNPDGKKLLEDAAKKEDQAQGLKVVISFDMAFKMAVSGVSATMDMDMKGEIEMAANNNISKVAMSLNMPSILGLNMDEECYVDTESNMLYLKTSEGWRRAELNDGENPLDMLSLMTDSMDIAGDSTDDSAQMSSSMASMFAIAKDIKTKGKTKYNDVQCYEIEMELNPDTMAAMLNMSMAGLGGSDALGSMTGTDTEELASALGAGRIYAYVGTGDGLLHGLEMDMGAVLEIAMQQSMAEESGAEDLTFEKSELKIGIVTDYKENSIEIPAEAKESNLIDDVDELLAESMLMASFTSQTDSGLFGDDALDADDLNYDDIYDYNEIIDEDAPRFEDMRMVDSLESTEDGDIKVGNEVDTYGTNDENFYAVTEIVNITDPLTVYIDWYKLSDTDDEDQLISSAEVDADSSGQIVSSTLALGSDSWPVGLYYVQFSASLQGEGRDKAIDLGSLLSEIIFFVE